MIDFIKILKATDGKILKGYISHHKLAPKIDGQPFRTFIAPPDAYQSSVLLLLKEVNSKLQILFTLRSFSISSHRGQISFPGGRVESGESFLETALRETKEEIGISSDKIEIIKELSTLYVPPSNAIIHPFVGLLKHNVELNLNAQEVEEAFWIDLDYFLEKNNITVEKWNFNGKLVDVPMWRIHHKQVLWGATAMILSEFIDIYNDIINFEK